MSPRSSSVHALTNSGIGRDAARWLAVRARAASADGSFVYAVKTTGVYCRPTCAARLPKRENVEFYADAESAERAGFRACRRCQPKGTSDAERDRARVTRLCRFIEQSEHTPTLAELAAHAKLSSYYVQRLFKRMTGLSPRAYAAARRAERVRGGLAGAQTVTQAIQRAGYGSSSRFYENSRVRLGMTPREYRAGAADLVIHYAVRPCSLGAVLVGATDRGVCAILLGDDEPALVRDLERRFARARLEPAAPRFRALIARAVAAVERPELGSTLPLDIRGTAFQERVWSALRAIAPGERRSYSELARTLGAPSAARAVARACAENPLAVAVPCHRVIAADGGMGGYRWGLERKRRLLERERPPARSRRNPKA